MQKHKCLPGVAFALIVTTFAIGSAQAQVSATGSVTATPSGGNYLYTISLHNTGTTPIETFWFSWLPDHYDFLPSTPTSIVAPTNWTDYVESGVYGKSIEFYDTGSSSPIAGGQTNSSFQFLSPDSPTTMAGAGAFANLPVTYSYVYSGTPSGPGADPLSASNVIFSMNVTVAPEPTTFALSAVGAIGLLARRRQKTTTIV
jgi:PEP-CTERM motif